MIRNRERKVYEMYGIRRQLWLARQLELQEATRVHGFNGRLICIGSNADPLTGLGSLCHSFLFTFALLKSEKGIPNKDSLPSLATPEYKEQLLGTAS
jgi:hypothetical protein